MFVWITKKALFSFILATMILAACQSDDSAGPALSSSPAAEQPSLEPTSPANTDPDEEPAQVSDDTESIEPPTDQSPPEPETALSSLLQGTWANGVRMPTPRSEMPAVEIDGLIYVPGGFGGDDVLEAYEPAGDRWLRLADMPDRRHHHAQGREVWLLHRRVRRKAERERRLRRGEVRQVLGSRFLLPTRDRDLNIHDRDEDEQ